MTQIPQSAYDGAAAVLSRSFRFVEWKYVMALKGNSAPFGDRGAPAHKAVTAIDRTKWIYVFSYDLTDYAPIKEEIRVEPNGQMFATPSKTIENPIENRGKPVALGTTLSLPRRQFGEPKAYRFYASRVRLPLGQIKALERTIHTFAPLTLLDPENNTSVIERDGQWLVPVVDPLNVVLRLQTAFTAAADDVVNYTAAHADLAPATRTAVELRRKKHLLATILKGIIGEEKNVGANNLVHQLKDQQNPLEEFLTHYDQQIEWRLKRRDWLANVLVSWLRSDAMSVASAAHRTVGEDAWVRFLVPWCHVLTRLFEAPVGRTYLASLLDDKSHFVHRTSGHRRSSRPTRFRPSARAAWRSSRPGRPSSKHVCSSRAATTCRTSSRRCATCGASPRREVNHGLAEEDYGDQSDDQGRGADHPPPAR